ncbi:olfactory receptor 6M1-like [Panthera uncia]|uniref:olfactory receptor 6M1-like n=1 Tax=Panthera uncia TaxID=29064 RepID=UPI0020FFF35B|nr:olfactory receptor 6M1-like [Panthera uncia]
MVHNDKKLVINTDHVGGDRDKSDDVSEDEDNIDGNDQCGHGNNDDDDDETKNVPVLTVGTKFPRLQDKSLNRKKINTLEFILLAVMSFDRYVAICNPLRYTIIMNSNVCLLLVLGCWVGAFFSVLCPIIVVSRLPYCYKEISHFFCDIAPLLQVACIDTHFIEMINFLLSSLVLLTSLVLTIVSYTYIISTILHTPSAQGRQKAFSTCASHITVVSIAYGSNIFMYVRPSQSRSLDFDKVTAVMTVMVTPLLNPFIYSLRNEKVKEVLREAINKIISLLHKRT